MYGVCERLIFLPNGIPHRKKAQIFITSKMDEIWYHFHIGDFDVRKKFIQMHFSFNFQTFAPKEMRAATLQSSRRRPSL